MGTPAPIHLAPLRCSRTWFNPRHPGSPKLRMGAWKLHDLSLVFQSYLGFVGVWIHFHTSWEGLLGVLSHLQTQGMTGGFWKTRVCVSFRWLDTWRLIPKARRESIQIYPQDLIASSPDSARPFLVGFWFSHFDFPSFIPNIQPAPSACLLPGGSSLPIFKKHPTLELQRTSFKWMELVKQPISSK